MDVSNRNLDDTDRIPPPSLVEDIGGLQSEQHVTPIHRVAGLLVVKGLGESHNSLQYHWTVKKRVTEMTVKTASILIKVWVIECLRNGMGLSDYLGLEYLIAFVLGGKVDPLELRDEKDRQAVMLGIFLVTSMRGNWLTLGEVSEVSPLIKQEIIQLGWLPSQRVFSSWKQYHQPWKFLEVLAVPLDTYDERDKSTVRYSSYTKHYGNGGHISRTLKTPYDFELDGESTDRDPPEFNLQEIDQYNQILLMIEREKLAKRFELK
jgi:hypothetical protein